MPQTIQSLIEKYVIEIQKIYGTHLKRIILYGSYARGDFKADSDVDIMILLDMTDLELKKYSQQLSYMTFDFNLDNDIDIKPIAKSENHFKKWNMNYAFYANIQREGVILYGEAEEIRHASDYDDFYIASREEAERQVSVADEFIQLAEKYCMLS